MNPLPLPRPGICRTCSWFEEALKAALAKGDDYLGVLAWREYQAGESERVEGFPWYMGVPPVRRNGRPGVAFMRDEFIVLRSARLSENALAAGGGDPFDVRLGEMAHQLGWTTAIHDGRAAVLPRS